MKSQKDSTNKSKVKDKALKFIGALDFIRWNSNESSYSELNTCDNGFTEEDKILINWLTYISDRQMPFEKVWIYGGYVYSHIVKKWKKCKTIREINQVFIDHIGKKDGKDDAEENKQAYRVYVENYDGKNKKLNLENLNTGDDIEFNARFYSTDLKYIYLTLCILFERYNKSLFKYLKTFTDKVDDHNDKMKAIIYAFYTLSYKDNKQGTKKQFKEFLLGGDDIHFSNEYSIIIKNINAYYDYAIDELEKFDNESKRYSGAKRLWCCIRDYLKAYQYKKYFRKCLESHKININNHALRESLKYIELPGDVWNNNSKFRNCILEKDETNMKLAKILREQFNNNTNNWNKLGIYPECFDVSFDLAMRMCDNRKCKSCLMNKRNIASKLCINETSSLCTLSMIYCGYEFKCLGKEKCPFKDLL